LDVQCRDGIPGGTTAITGQFSEREAKDLALLIRAGALPVPVEVVAQRTVGPTLGDAAIDASIKAAVIGAFLTILYMVVYYRLLGLLAALALGAYGLISFSALLALDATLTLPGIAGFVLAVGMAVDANVLVFERIKEERAAGATVRAAARNGFRRAWTAIADSNATTVLAAVLLFFYASGPVRGFGITLTVGVLVSMFSAVVLTRVLVDLVVSSRRLTARSGIFGLEVGGRAREWIDRRRPDLIGHWRRWLVVSLIGLLFAGAGLATRGLDYGLDFSGGRLMEFEADRPVDLDALRSAVADAGFPRAVVQASGDRSVTIRTEELSPAEATSIEDAVRELAGTSTLVRDEFVGPTIGNELRRKGVTALVLALVLQLSYLAFRFRFTFGAAVVGAMFHDVVLLLGIFAWLGKTIDGVFLAALLTVIGYSINDSVVVFDRIRELRRSRPSHPLVDVANDACLQTVPRTINTGLGALFILGALYFLGGDTLTDFALALLIGILVGTYSSVFTAAPLAVLFEPNRSRASVSSTHGAERRVLVPAAGGSPPLPKAPKQLTPHRGGPPRPRKRKGKRR
jgi:SecD/SecF fusion protein